MKRIVILLLAATCLTINSTTAEQPDGNTSKPEVLNNNSIIELKELGLGESVIMEKIKTSQCDFDTSLSGLKQLKTAGVSDTVITAMIATKSAAPGIAPASQSTDPNDPASPHDPGIWFYEESDGKPKMMQLEPSVYAQHKTGAGFFMAWGETVKQEAIIPRAHAEFTITNRQPVFYFYFEHTKPGLSDTQGATSPNEYILGQFDVKEKDHERHLVIGSLNAYSGGTSGAESKSTRAFDFQKLAPGIYKVSPKSNLGDGEYGFFYAGNSGNGGKVFDFGIKGSAESEPQPQVTETNKATTTKHGFTWFKKKNAAEQDASNDQTNQTSLAKP